MRIDVQYFFERSTPEPNSGCWIWLNAVAWNGYGVVNVGGGKTSRAHRASYIAATGATLPSSVDVCHRCDVRCCVNPDHLFAGTRKDNMTDCSRKGRVVVPGLKGEDCPASKLKAAQVIAIRADARSNRALGRVYGVDKGTISHIKRGLTWRSL